jgi:hypothetical protein
MITIKVDSRGVNRAQAFVAAYRNQLPFATSVALNQTARDVQLALKSETTRSFTAPVAFTKSAFRYKKSSKLSLVAEVFPSPDRPYFDPQTFGGQRRWKAYEGFIRGLAGGNLPPGKLIPTKLAQNAAGNPKRSLFGQIESNLSTTDQGGFMIGTPRGARARAPGVYRRSRGRLFPYFLVSDSEPTYQPRFPFEQLGNATVRRVFPTNLSAAVDRAIASAR